MPKYSHTCLSNDALLNATLTTVKGRRSSDALLLSQLAEIDRRDLYLPLAYPSMHAFCVGMLGLSDHSAYKRIRAARVGRRFPETFEMVADGRLHVAALVLLKPCLTRVNSAELFAAAEGKSKRQVQEMLAVRFPDLVEHAAENGQITAVSVVQLAPGPVKPVSQVSIATTDEAPGRVDPAPTTIATTAAEPSPAPAELVAKPCLFRCELTLDEEAVEAFRRAQELVSHQLPSGDLNEIMKRALLHYVRSLEKRRFSATDQPRAPRSNGDGRHIPTDVQRRARAAAKKKGTQDETPEVKAKARRATRAEREQEIAARAAAQQRALEEFPWLREMQARADGSSTPPPSS